MVRLDCRQFRHADLWAVDQIARVQVAVHRRGSELRLTNATLALVQLIGFAGLGGVLRVESGWQAEEREYPCRGKKKGQLDDLAV
jgi:hypothetical protein